MNCAIHFTLYVLKFHRIVGASDPLLFINGILIVPQ